MHFIWLSDSCIPFKKFNYIYNYLQIDKSYFNIAPSNMIFPKYNNLLKYFKKNIIKKAGMPAIINRKHANLFINNDNIIREKFKNINVGDEIVYITLLHYYNLQHELILTNNVASNAIIFSQWTDMKNYRKFSNSIIKSETPITYLYICPEEIDYFIKSKSLFGRKFDKNCKGLQYLQNKINS